MPWSWFTLGTRARTEPVRWLALAVTVCVVLFTGSIHAGAAEQPAASPASQSDSDSKVRQLLQLLSDPDVRQALSRQAAPEARAPQPPMGDTMAVGLGEDLQQLRDHLSALAASVHELPGQTRMAHSMAVDALQERGLVQTGAALAVFVALGFGAQYLFHLAGRPFRRWLLALKLETVDERLRAVFARLLYGLGLIISYALGSVGAFLLFDWPSLIKVMLLGLLLAFLNVRLATVVGRFLFAPGAERFRVVPISTPAAWFFYARLIVAATVISFGWQIIVVLGRFGLAPLAHEVCVDALGLALLLLGLETVWRRPPLGADTDGAVEHTRGLRVSPLILSPILIVLWALWVVQAVETFWLLAFATSLPLAIITARASVAHILRPADAVGAVHEERSVQAVLFERGVRSFIIISAALLLGWIFNIDIVSLTMRDTLGTRVLRGLISVVIIALAADFLWTLIRAVIDRRLKQPLPHSSTDADVGHAARLQTLLPIIGNILFATIVILAGMMMLAALGVQIGPLIASAGVVGVAIGFGAQTLVRDVISGIFYLVDDAFRIGEYIQSGNYKGTVEFLQPALGQAAPPARCAVHGALRRARCRAEPEPRLGGGQDCHERALRHRPREGSQDHQADRNDARRGPGIWA